MRCVNRLPTPMEKSAIHENSNCLSKPVVVIYFPVRAARIPVWKIS